MAPVRTTTFDSTRPVHRATIGVALVKMLSSGTIQTAATNSDGYFQILYLLPGRYSLQVET